jgi:hypothetical protein
MTRFRLGEGDSWGVVLGHHPLTYIIDWAATMPSKEMCASLAIAPVEPYRSHVIEANLAVNYPRFQPSSDGDSFRSLDLLKGAHDGETLVIVGSGPSSHGVAERLAPYREYCKVMACNNAMREVRDADYFFLIEALPKESWWEFADPSQTKLIAPIHAGKATAEKWARDDSFYFWIKDMRRHDGDLERLTTIEGACHVGTSAMHVAHTLGFSRVLLVGFDFCAKNIVKNYETQSFEAVFYGDGTPVSETYAGGSTGFLTVDLTGEEVMVFPSMLEHLRAMEIAVSIAERAGVEVWNCAEGGMLDTDWRASLEDVLVGSL